MVIQMANTFSAYQKELIEACVTVLAYRKRLENVSLKDLFSNLPEDFGLENIMEILRRK